ncbi:hypothetical protein LTR62_004845 [Meristemomyces frigidus]|uniref:Uncharacterized protein n=1 Tax=Meristemomyces frigidus TaxID=1508187 RepID=A0AAN7TH81_9PEZI|nr:hypothetical protein LTR62_004845 [Meristemomyces frigidus]
MKCAIHLMPLKRPLGSISATPFNRKPLEPAHKFAVTVELDETVQDVMTKSEAELRNLYGIDTDVSYFSRVTDILGVDLAMTLRLGDIMSENDRAVDRTFTVYQSWLDYKDTLPASSPLRPAMSNKRKFEDLTPAEKREFTRIKTTCDKTGAEPITPVITPSARPSARDSEPAGSRADTQTPSITPRLSSMPPPTSAQRPRRRSIHEPARISPRRASNRQSLSQDNVDDELLQSFSSDYEVAAELEQEHNAFSIMSSQARSQSSQQATMSSQPTTQPTPQPSEMSFTSTQARTHNNNVGVKKVCWEEAEDAAVGEGFSLGMTAARIREKYQLNRSTGAIRSRKKILQISNPQLFRSAASAIASPTPLSIVDAVEDEIQDEVPAFENRIFVEEMSSGLGDRIEEEENGPGEHKEVEGDELTSTDRTVLWDGSEDEQEEDEDEADERETESQEQDEDHKQEIEIEEQDEDCDEKIEIENERHDEVDQQENEHEEQDEICVGRIDVEIEEQDEDNPQETEVAEQDEKCDGDEDVEKEEQPEHCDEKIEVDIACPTVSTVRARSEAEEEDDVGYVVANEDQNGGQESKMKAVLGAIMVVDEESEVRDEEEKSETRDKDQAVDDSQAQEEDDPVDESVIHHEYEVEERDDRDDPEDSVGSVEGMRNGFEDIEKQVSDIEKQVEDIAKQVGNIEKQDDSPNKHEEDGSDQQVTRQKSGEERRAATPATDTTITYNEPETRSKLLRYIRPGMTPAKIDQVVRREFRHASDEVIDWHKHWCRVKVRIVSAAKGTVEKAAAKEELDSMIYYRDLRRPDYWTDDSLMPERGGAIIVPRTEAWEVVPRCGTGVVVGEVEGGGIEVESTEVGSTGVGSGVGLGLRRVSSDGLMRGRRARRHAAVAARRRGE